MGLGVLFKGIWTHSSNFGFVTLQSIKTHEEHKKNIHQNRLKIGHVKTFEM